MSGGSTTLWIQDDVQIGHEGAGSESTGEKDRGGGCDPQA